MVLAALEAELPWQRRIAYNMSILSPMKPKFDTVRDIPQQNKCTKCQLILTKNREEMAYFLVAMVTIFIKIHLK